MLRAKRNWMAWSPSIRTEQLSARDRAMIRSVRRRASPWSRIIGSDVLALGVEHVDFAEPGRYRAMRHRGRLHGLSLAAKERAAQKIGRGIAQAVHRIPELGGLALI